MESQKFNKLLKKYKYSREAVKELYEAYYLKIVTYINRQFYGALDGRDIAQQFFLKLFEIRVHIIRAPDSWVYAVAKNIALEILRRKNKRLTIERRAAVLERFDVPEYISDTLNCLNDKEQKVVYLHYWEQYRLKEIAEILKIKYGSVKHYHRTAKLKLKKEYIEL